jgi:hypothetical protein
VTLISDISRLPLSELMAIYLYSCLPSELFCLRLPAPPKVYLPMAGTPGKFRAFVIASPFL